MSGGTIKIPLKDFMGWFQGKLDQKHRPSLEPLKTLFLTFATLVKQLIVTYLEIKEKLEKQQGEMWSLGEGVVDSSMQILISMTSNIPVCFDLAFCQNFTHEFQRKLTLLCSYYHSLSHIEQRSSGNIKKQKQRIVNGINMLYIVTGDIKEEAKEFMHLLKSFGDYKKLFGKKVTSILGQLPQFQNLYSLEFYDTIPDLHATMTVNQLVSKPQRWEESAEGPCLYSFMRGYLQLISHSCEAQIQLENALEQPIRICNQLKSKKKVLNHMMQEPNWGALSKQLNLLLKPNFVTREIKKIRVDQFMDFLQVVSSRKDSFIESTFDYQKSGAKIRQLIQTMIEDLKELEKVEKAQLVEIHQGSQKPNGDLKKTMELLSEYQGFMYRFYKLNQQMKSTEKFVQTIVGKEFRAKVRLTLF